MKPLPVPEEEVEGPGPHTISIQDLQTPRPVQGVMYKFFGSFNEVDSHNKSKKSNLVLDKLLVTQCGWLWLFMTVSMVMTITNFWEIIFMGLRETTMKN